MRERQLGLPSSLILGFLSHQHGSLLTNLAFLIVHPLSPKPAIMKGGWVAVGGGQESDNSFALVVHPLSETLSEISGICIS